MSRVSVNALLAGTLTVILGLNLNGLFYLWLGLNQAFSGAILLLSLALILNLAKSRIEVSAEFVIFSLSVFLYLLLGGLFYSHIRSVTEPEQYFKTYLSSLVVIYSLALYVGTLSDPRCLWRYLCLVRNVFLFASISVLASPLLYAIYSNPAPSSAYRMGGFFANPNEAAMASLLGFCLIVGFPFTSRALQILAVCATSVAVVLTFSKTGILILILLGGVYLFIRGGTPSRVVYCLLLIFVTLFFVEPRVLEDSVISNSLYELDQSQAARIRAIFSVFSGDLNEDVSTGRSYLWGLAVSKILGVLPGALGLGSMHHMIGGFEEFGVWQGVHNTFLMFVGEAGFLPAFLLAFSLALLFQRVWRLQIYRPAFFGVAVVLLIDMLVTHSALGLRYHNLALASMFGLAMNRDLLHTEHP